MLSEYSQMIQALIYSAAIAVVTSLLGWGVGSIGATAVPASKLLLLGAMVGLFALAAQAMLVAVYRANDELPDTLPWL